MDRHQPGSLRVNGVSGHQEDLRVWVPDHLNLDLTVRTTLAQYLDRSPTR